MNLCTTFNSSESSTELNVDNEDEIKSKVKFEQLLDKYLAKTRPRPKVINGNPLWKQILSEHAVTAWHAMNQEETCLPYGIDTEEWKYLDKEIMPTLLRAIEETMNLAKRLKVDEGKFRAFNYLDTLVHYILNMNTSPEEPIRKIEDFDEIKEHLKKVPVTLIAKHQLWSRNKAATLIQKNVRGWLVRKRPEIHEMREFWKVIREKLKTSVGPALQRPERLKLSDILPPGQDISSDTDGTIYNDEKQFWTMHEKNTKLSNLSLLSLTQKPQRKFHSKRHNKHSQREKHRLHDLSREATVQTERIVHRAETDCEEKNPFNRNRETSRSAKARGSRFPKNKPKETPTKSRHCTKKPEISQEELDVAISFEDLKYKNE